MKRFLIIPKSDNIEKSLEIAAKYGTGFEYNDFFLPDVLDSREQTEDRISFYRGLKLPEYCTLHGAFFDVTVFSPDRLIRETSDMRVKQSISAAKALGAKGVVFHTNYNPFLNSAEYVKNWINANESYWSRILAENSDVNIYLENMFDSSPEILAELSERLCGFENYGICLDYAHASLTAVPQREWVVKLGKYVRHIHINDNDLKSDLHLAIGDGIINWAEFYGLYEKFMENASVLIETSSVENQEKSIKRLIADGFMN
ncbi:MAG: sugar phosphate isomerase/epimerase [Oscillospiraceae bacterium]|nr:sugar phosphate isomerase/epimerase [Oscillospiraceae bacterium]